MKHKKILCGLFAVILGACAAPAENAHPLHSFSAAEIRSTDITPFTKWTDMLGRLDRSPAMPGTWNNPGNLQSLPLQDKIRVVNDTVNAYHYMDDRNVWGREDYWQTPYEFYQRSGGDCEDFAIAKYVWLRALGVPEDKLRLMVVYDTVRETPHTILTVKSGPTSLILDNQEKKVLDGESVPHYRPIFSINRDGWWIKKTAKENFIKTSALY